MASALPSSPFMVTASPPVPAPRGDAGGEAVLSPRRTLKRPLSLSIVSTSTLEVVEDEKLPRKADTELRENIRDRTAALEAERHAPELLDALNVNGLAVFLLVRPCFAVVYHASILMP